jgi:hypothetical protein
MNISFVIPVTPEGGGDGDAGRPRLRQSPVRTPHERAQHEEPRSRDGAGEIDHRRSTSPKRDGDTAVINW